MNQTIADKLMAEIENAGSWQDAFGGGRSYMVKLADVDAIVKALVSEPVEDDPNNEIPNREAYEQINNSLISEPKAGTEAKDWINVNEKATEWNRADIDEAIAIINALEPVEDVLLEGEAEYISDFLKRCSEAETDNEIAKRVLEKYIEQAPYSDTIITIEYLFDWLDRKPYDPHEVAQEGEDETRNSC